MTAPRLRWRIAANSATLANALSGVGAIAFTLAGNKLFALFLILTGVGWDGLDGFFSRRAGGGGTTFGRVADSFADAITFCLAPAVAVAYNPYDAPLWAPWTYLAWVAGIAVAVVGLARLVYFTTVAYRRHHFTGASTPQNTMWILVLLLLFQRPAFLGTQALLTLVLVLLFVPLMVLPIPYPKLRRGAPLRRVTGVMAVALSLSLIAANFLAAVGGWFNAVLYLTSFAACAVAFGLLVLFYLAGPLVTPPEVDPPSHGPTPSA